MPGAKPLTQSSMKETKGNTQVSPDDDDVPNGSTGSSALELLATELRQAETTIHDTALTVVETVKDVIDDVDIDITINAIQEFVLPAPRIALIYRVGRMLSVGVSIIACLMPWCAFLMEPRAVMTLDKVDAVRGELAKWDTPLSLVRAALPRVLASVLGPLLMALCAEYHLHAASRSPLGELGEMAFKSLFPFFLGLPLVGLTLQQRPVRVEPIMSALDLQKDEGDDVTSSTSVAAGVESYSYGDGRTNTTRTILRRTMLPAEKLTSKCTSHSTRVGSAFTSVAYEFMTNDWQRHMLPHGKEPTEVYRVPPRSSSSATATTPTSTATKSSFTGSEAALFESAFARAVYLYIDAVILQDTLSSGTNGVALRQLQVDTVSYHNANKLTGASNATDATQHIHDYVHGYFANDRTSNASSVWSTLLRAKVSDIAVEYTKVTLSDTIAFVAVTLVLPLENTIWHRELAPDDNGVLVEQDTPWPGSGSDVVYEIDVANECGPTTCAIQNRGLSPDPQVVAYGVCPRTGDCSRSADPTAMWLFGFGRRIEGDAFELLPDDTTRNLASRKAVVRNPREFHRVTMGMLTVEIEALDQKFHAKCHTNRETGTQDACTGLSFSLNSTDPVTNTSQYLLLSQSRTGISEFGSGFNLSGTTADPRGRPLVTRFTTGVRTEYEILEPRNFGAAQWGAPLTRTQCSRRMERLVATTKADYMAIDQTLQVTYTAGLFFLFDNARLVTQLPPSIGQNLDLQRNIKSIDVALVVPWWQAVLCLVLCLVLAVHCLALYYHRGHYRKGLTDASIDKLQTPEVLIRALADSTVFPRQFLKLQVHTMNGNDGGDKTVVNLNLKNVPLQAIEFGPFAISANGFSVRRSVGEDDDRTSTTTSSSTTQSRSTQSQRVPDDTTAPSK